MAALKGRALLRQHDRRASAWAAAIVGVATAVPPLLGQFFYGLDLTRINLAMMCALREQVPSGGLGLSRVLGNGGPLLARPDAGLFYPVRWAALALPPDAGVAFEVVVHLAICAAAGAWLARSFRVRGAGAIAAGVAMAFSGTALDLLRHAHYLVAAAWLPLMWAGARHALRPRAGLFPIAAIFVGAAGCMLGAEPQAFAIGAGLVAIELGARALRRRRPARAWAAVGLACAAGFLVGLAQWLPALGELALTPRKGPLPAGEVLAWSMGASDFAGVVLPGMPTQLVQGVTTLHKVMGGDATPWNKTPYLGALVLCAALAAVTIRRARAAAAVAAGGLVLSLGGHLPVFPLLLKVAPVLGRFRYPAKYWWVTSIALIVLAAIALDAARRDPRVRRRVWGLGGVLAAALLATWAAVSWRAAELDAFAARFVSAGSDDVLPTLSGALSSSAVHAVLMLGLGLGLLATPRLRAFAFAAAALDLIAAAPYALTTGPRLADQPLPDAIPRDAVLCVHPALAGRFFPLESGGLQRSATLYLRTHLVPELQACAGVASGIVYSPLESSAGAGLGQGVRAGNASAVRAFGCTHLLGLAPFAPDAPLSVADVEVRAAELAAPFGEARLYALPEPLEPVFAVADARPAATEAEALSRVARARGRAEVIAIVDDPLDHLHGAPLPQAAPTVKVLDDGLTAKRIEVDGPGLIGLRTPMLVGWTARRETQALPTVRIAAHQLGVLADAAGTVELVYRPPGAAAAAVASLLGVLTLGGALFVQRRRSR